MKHTEAVTLEKNNGWWVVRYGEHGWAFAEYDLALGQVLLLEMQWSEETMSE